MRSTTSAEGAIRSLIASIPEQRLRALILEWVLAALRCLTAQPPEPSDATILSSNGRRHPSRDKTRAHWSQARRDAHNAKHRERRRPAAIAAAGGPRRRGRKPKAASEEKATSEGKASISNGAGAGNGQISAKALWRHATKLEPKAPWRAVVRELGVLEGAAQNAHRDGALPPNISTAAAARFLTL